MWTNVLFGEAFADTGKPGNTGKMRLLNALKNKEIDSKRVRKPTTREQRAARQLGSWPLCWSA